MRSVSANADWSRVGVAAPSGASFECNDSERRILVAAAQDELRYRTALVLKSHGFSPVPIESAGQIATALVLTPIDLALVVASEGPESVAAICEPIRRVRPTVPLFVLSDNPTEEAHVAALEAGADDYLPSSVSSRVLVVRINGALRRMGLLNAERLEHGGILVELGSHRVFAGGQEINLTSTEYRLVQLFLRNPGRVFTRRHLLDNIWNVPSDVVTRTVDTHVKRLRQKLGASGSSIETVRGIGYRCGLAPGVFPSAEA